MRMGNSYLNISRTQHTQREQQITFSHKLNKQLNLASLNMTSLKNLQLPSIPLAQQKEIVESIVTKLSEIKSARKELIVAHHRSKALRQSILAKAFKGELV
ncbi:hypothetical protein TM7_0589 [candidate division TM7 genomosp. GTL1]|nr:hypothetical protein TM7_0589 [candidate division TM7 genomosp. GTL1]